MQKKDAMKRGWKWSDYEPPAPENVKIIPAEKLHDDIAKTPDDILQWAITCEVTGKPFKVIQQELEFYRKKGLPIPHRSPQQRHRDRIAKQNPFQLYARTCAKCSKEIQTTYAPERLETVYCEECYLKEVY